MKDTRSPQKDVCIHGVDVFEECPECKAILRGSFHQDKPIPTTTATASGIEAEVCNDIAHRQQVGIAKYGQTVAENLLDLRAWLQHAYEECLDQAVYLRRAIAELDKR